MTTFIDYLLPLMEKFLSVYQHPTTTVFIDDNQRFLDSLSFQLDPRIAHKTFQNAGEAISWIREANRNFAGRGLSIEVSYDEQVLSMERRVVSVDLEQIYRRVMNPKRFLTPSVLVVDYAMPQMNGVAVCEALGNLPCKKIMFTGQADDKVAIDAFNQGLIDHFLTKNDHAVLDHLAVGIKTLGNAFFVDQSSTLKDLLGRQSHSFLFDPVMTDLIGRLRKQYDFVEYYLFLNPTGLLFFDFHGTPTLMVIETEAGMLAHFEAARDAGGPAGLVAGLEAMQIVPFFSDTGMYVDAIEDSWQAYCLPAQHCQGQQDYFWALFDLPCRYLPGPIYSYADFLSDRPKRQ
ncbi:response regulator [Duganella rhizosphaerae]|uniref:response regulator n=1 Tax=Duganella rhizosphaerae TaxID=2885763 RepID=UPI00403F1959